ncbi:MULTISPECIES: GAF domain-containing protein [unclassified Coleofasciculus]|uniref:GAF domain-containing protein n=1 Tax=unclassified Coleofasciculus TaxID=2692782 RepID=UPI001880FAD2|nr:MULTISPECIES: GAF domain-containing protein [unclassified Coleofasciculus]MBE9125143.1 GAF domain-containing protein [Coleofasciculus sp. LEGE 07081]MBE9148360.1 GAF domain-containing protein [Coleofasciculus sp. LEGE 07092]
MSIIRSLQGLAGEAFVVPFAGLFTKVMIVLVAEVLPKGRQSTSSVELASETQSENIRRLQKQSLALMRLARPQTLYCGDLKAAIQEITEATAEALEVGRVSVWLYNAGRSHLKCIDRYEQGRHPGNTGEGEKSLHWSVDNQLSISPLGLDVPICLREQIVGVLRCEQTTSIIRQWTPQDQNFGTTIANIVALALEANNQQQANAQLPDINSPPLKIDEITEENKLGTQHSAQLGWKSDISYLAQAPAMESTPDSPERNRISRLAAVVENRLKSVMTLLGNQSLPLASRRTVGWVANAIAVAIDQYWARAELLSRRESLLFGLANQIRNSLELDTILETAVESIRSLLKIDRCQFLWYRSQEGAPYWEVVKEAKNPNLPSQISQYTTVEMAPFAERFLNRQIVRIDEVGTFGDPVLQQFLTALGYTSILAIPIQTRAGEMGAISCSHGTEVRPWDNSEVELLQAVVAQLTIALDQAALYAEARQTAEVARAQAQELEQTLNQLKATQAQLVQSEKMSSLGQLVAGVTHELNNPVNFIHNNLTYASAYIYDLLTLVRLYQEYFPNPPTLLMAQAELIDINFIADDLPKLLHSMQRGTDRISSIVISLRNFSRLDEAEMKPVDLNEGLESTLLMLQYRLKSKDARPEISVIKEYDNLPKVECYPGQLNQVFLNILNNAIDALEKFFAERQEPTSPAITIRTSIVNPAPDDPTSLAATQLNEQRVVIQITDNGLGMTEFIKARLFDPFFSTKPVGKGTGLGLAICYQIVVDYHHGALNCKSAPGKGTEFWIEIPIRQSQD